MEEELSVLIASVASWVYVTYDNPKSADTLVRHSRWLRDAFNAYCATQSQPDDDLRDYAVSG